METKECRFKADVITAAGPPHEVDSEDRTLSEFDVVVSCETCGMNNFFTTFKTEIELKEGEGLLERAEQELNTYDSKISNKVNKHKLISCPLHSGALGSQTT